MDPAALCRPPGRTYRFGLSLIASSVIDVPAVKTIDGCYLPDQVSQRVREMRPLCIRPLVQLKTDRGLLPAHFQEITNQLLASGVHVGPSLITCRSQHGVYRVHTVLHGRIRSGTIERHTELPTTSEVLLNLSVIGLVCGRACVPGCIAVDRDRQWLAAVGRAVLF